MPDGDAIAGRINELAGSGEYDLVVATRDWHPPDHGSFAEQGGPWPVHCVAGTPGAELHHALDPTPIDIVVDKGQDPGPRAIRASRARPGELLREHGVDHVTVVGLATDYCVKNTALDALREGFGVTVDSTATRGVDVEPGDSERALEEVRAAGAERGVMRRPGRLHEHAAAARRRPARAGGDRDGARATASCRRTCSAEAWENIPLPIGSGQTISQPLVVARMCELLELDGVETVLDVGTGSGYHAALLARLARHVYSIEVHASLSRQAADNLRVGGRRRT